MAIKGFNESKLSDSEVYKGLQEIRDNQQTAKDLIKNAKHLNAADIESAYIGVKRLSDGFSRSSLQAFDNGSTVLLFNDIPEKSINQGIPFMTFNSQNGYKTFVFMDKYITKNRDGLLNCNGSTLRDLLGAAAVSTGLKQNYSVLQRNQFLQEVLMNIYTKLFTRILKVEFAYSDNKELDDSITYWVNKFFIKQILGTTMDDGFVDNIASKHFRYINDMKYIEIKDMYNDKAPVVISDLLALLADSAPRMKSLSFPRFMSSWIQRYYPPAILAIDNVEYLVFIILALLSGNGAIVNANVADCVTETNGAKRIKDELIKLL